VVSAETINLPDDVMGYALVKNRLSDAGILAINIGLVDPRYEGPLSSTLINFGSSPHRLRPGDPFLRLTFHKVEPDARAKRIQRTRSQYIAETKRNMLTTSRTFLNVSEVAEQAAESAFGLSKKRLLWVLPIAGIVLACLGVFLSLLIPFSAFLWVRSTDYFRDNPAHVVEEVVVPGTSTPANLDTTADPFEPSTNDAANP